MKTLAYIFAASLLLSFPDLSASDESLSEKIEEYYWQFTSNHCVNQETLHPADFSGCKAEAAEASIKELEDVFKQVLNKIDNEDSAIYSKQDKEEWKKMLKRSQANWEKHRDLEIEIDTSMGMKGATGTGVSNVISGLLMEKNYFRVRELKQNYGL